MCCHLSVAKGGVILKKKKKVARAIIGYPLQFASAKWAGCRIMWTCGATYLAQRAGKVARAA